MTKPLHPVFADQNRAARPLLNNNTGEELVPLIESTS